MPCFRAKKTVRAALDFVAAIETAALLQSMKIITHDRGVICPAFKRRRHIVVPVKKANPLAGFADSRHADQFRTETRHNDAKALLFVGKNIQRPTVTVFFCVRKLHRVSMDRRLAVATALCAVLGYLEAKTINAPQGRGYKKNSWEQAAHLFRFDNAFNADRHRGCAM